MRNETLPVDYRKLSTQRTRAGVLSHPHRPRSPLPPFPNVDNAYMKAGGCVSKKLLDATELLMCA